MLQHAADLAIVRGVSMDTLTHEVGRRFFNTGKFPRGLQASGSSLNTVVSGQSPALGNSLDLPNLVLSSETFNETYPAFASGVLARTSADVMTVLTPQTQAPVFFAQGEAALETFERNNDSCEAHGYDVDGLVSAFRASQAQARRMTNGSKAAAFNFTASASMETRAILDAMGVRTAGTGFNSTDLAGPAGRAAIAAQALSQGLSHVVSLSLANGLDDHNDIYGAQGIEQRAGWEALGRLLAHLKTVQTAPGSGVSIYDRTTMLVFSEFARTPLVNVRDGRDHHLTNSCLIKGPGIRGNVVFGASSEVGMGVSKWNLRTGALDPAGVTVKPAHVHATLLNSMGLGWGHLCNQGAKLLEPLLKSTALAPGACP
jgi:uncharacterized protein (DUF1501 family)